MATKTKKKPAKKPRTKAKAMKPKKAPPKKALAKAAPPKPAPVPKGLAPGMPWVTPYLCVKDVGAALAFYAKAFGFKERFRMPMPDGKIAHAEMAHRSGVIMMGPEDPMKNSKSPASLGGSPVGMYVYVEDVDKLFAQAKGAGAAVVSEPCDMFWGDRMATVKDPDGHMWSLATFKKAVTPEEIAAAMAKMAPPQPPPST